MTLNTGDIYTSCLHERHWSFLKFYYRFKWWAYLYFLPKEQVLVITVFKTWMRNIKSPLESYLYNYWFFFCLEIFRDSLDLAFKYFTSSTLTVRLAGLSQIAVSWFICIIFLIWVTYLHLMDSLSGDLNYFNDPSINKTFLHWMSSIVV